MEIFIYTDGSSLGNPGPGGYGALLKIQRKEIVVKGGAPMTTNNRMEMTAAIEALKKVKALKFSAKKINIFSDSNLVVKTMAHGWKKKENIDLWQALLQLVASFESKGCKFEWHWVKGHASHPENTKCDALAVAEAKKIQKKSGGAKTTVTFSPAFFCQRCGKPVKGKLTKLAESDLIRADCELCGKFIKFAKHTRANLTLAKISQSSLF